MIRPVSIVRYERLYAASFVLGLVASGITWAQRTALFAANPMLAQMPWLLPAMQAFGIAIAVLLWYFTARAPSIVAKWVVVVFAAFSALGILLSLGALALGNASLGVAVIASIAVNALYIAAAVQLFDPEARLWFGEQPDLDDDDDDDMAHDMRGSLSDDR